MTQTVSPPDSEQFRAAIQHHLGLYFDDTKLGFLGEVLQRRAGKRNRSTDQYLSEFSRGAGADELSALAQDLTVSETYFFRNIEQFAALREIVLPARMRARGAARTLRLLSAACSSGEEAYTIAIVLKETVVEPGWTVTCRAVDINPSVLARARRARYSGWAMRETPEEMKQRWFRADDRELILSPSVRDMVSFDLRNIAADDPDLWPRDYYDVIFCRNAMMYFAPDQARVLVERMATALAPDGYLFLGHAETLRGLSDAFHLRHTHGTFYYQRKDGGPFPRPAVAAPPVSLFPPNLAPAAIAPGIDESWIDAIRRSSERIEALTAKPDGAMEAPERTSERTPARPRWDLAPVLDLLRVERFADALDHLRLFPAEADNDSDFLLIKAMLLAHGAAFAEAEDVCRRLLVLDELNAGAHYIVAICREELGDQVSAAEHDRVAIYLDAAFAMPRLHAGLLARRMGDREQARRDLSRALALLRLEDASRLLLFGGGFSRHSLIALTDAALKDCGGQP